MEDIVYKKESDNGFDDTIVSVLKAVEKKGWAIVDCNVAEQEKGLYRKKGGGNEWKNIPANKKEVQKLTNDQILELTKMVVKIEMHYGFPCDIEWAMEKKNYYITQSRPITTL